MRYSVVLLPEDDGRFTATVPALPGCVTFGNSPDQALERVRDAITQYVASLEAHGEPVPEEHGQVQVALVEV
ncbi:MAG TPA: type II toxin-antitoxin system HicB family antitoxin [Chloroflexota bacterium]|jgi:predicted RNase H-like HicB family nuclease